MDQPQHSLWSYFSHYLSSIADISECQEKSVTTDKSIAIQNTFLDQVTCDLGTLLTQTFSSKIFAIRSPNLNFLTQMFPMLYRPMQHFSTSNTHWQGLPCPSALCAWLLCNPFQPAIFWFYLAPVILLLEGTINSFQPSPCHACFSKTSWLVCFFFFRL